MVLEKLSWVVKRALELGAEAAEAFSATVATNFVFVRNEQVVGVASKLTRGVGIRVVVDGRIGFASTTSLDEKVLERVIQNAIQVSRTREKLKVSFPSKKPTRSLDIFDRNTAEASDELLEKAKVLRDAAYSACKVKDSLKVVSVRVATLANTVSIANSEGLEASYSATAASASVDVVLEDGKRTSNFEWVQKRRLKDISEEISHRAVEYAEALHKEKVSIEHGEYDLILDPMALYDLIGYAFVPAINADNVREGRSYLKGKVGERILPEKMSLVDEPLIPEAIGSRPFDDEGVEARETYVVENGVLKTYLYNIVAAAKEGRETTGHAARRSPLTEPTIAPLNLTLRYSSTLELEEMIAEVKKGIYVKHLIGAHTANLATGDVSVVLGNAAYIRDGEIAGEVKQAMVGANVLEVLSKIDVVGKRLFSLDNLYLPHARAKGVRVSA